MNRGFSVNSNRPLLDRLGAVAESTLLIDGVQRRIDDFLAAQTSELDAITPELHDFVSRSGSLLAGGKRFRALFCYWGWASITEIPDPIDPMPAESPDPTAVIAAAAGLELFHAAALVHDDIMDSSDIRRGSPSRHRSFEQWHREQNWAGDAASYGRSSALLLGDLLLGWSDELIDEAVTEAGSRGRATRAEFNRMRNHVTYGQYLDILEEQAWRSAPEAEQLRRAHRVVVYKSAKYSVEAPLRIGAALAGASAQHLSSLSAYGLPLGIAFQLRDDLLGVFGDSAVTGKPTGDDLREGKRTMLIAFARRGLPGNARELLDELLGDPELSADQVYMLQSTIRESGALEKVEDLISKYVGEAKSAVDGAGLGIEATTELFRLADRATRRSF